MLKKTLVLLACSSVALTLATPVFAQSTAKIDKLEGPVPEAAPSNTATKPDTSTKTSEPATAPANSASAPSTAAPRTAATSATAPGGTAPNTVTASGNGVVPSFVALTQFPQIQQIATASSLPQFLNTLYKICIGAAAALALLMIMYAGVEIMRSSGSVTTNEKAKSRIQNAILGLVLVLAPTIVFGIINPSILDLNFGKNFGLLKSAPINQAAFNATNAGTGASMIGSAISYCNMTLTPEQQSCVATGYGTVNATFDQCVAGGSSAQACTNSATASARSSARACYPGLTNANADCLEGQIRAGIANNGRTSSGCTLFSPGQTNVNTPACQQACSSQSGCQLRQVTGRTYCQCQASTEAPNIEYMNEAIDSSTGGRCLESGQQTFTTAQECFAASARFLGSKHDAGKQATVHENCNGPAAAWSPSSVFYNIRNLPPCS